MNYYFYNIKKIKRYIENNKKVYLYPAGNYTKEILKTLEYAGIEISGIVDKSYKEIDGIKTIGVENVSSIKESVVFITSVKLECELRNELRNYKYGGIIENFFNGKIDNGSTLDDVLMDRMDLVLTSRCTLRCEKCANLMQYYEHPQDVQLDMIKKSMDKLLDAIDEIKIVYVLGGEPFIYKELKEVIAFLKNKEKIKQIVIITNGTLCPEDDEELWREFYNNKIKIHISDYGRLSRKKDSIVRLCSKYSLNCEIEENKVFFDTGNMKKRNRSEEELAYVFKNCKTQCRSLFKGELHYCPRSSHGVDLGIIEKRASDYVDIINNQDSALFRNQIKNFLNRDEYIEACDYCDIRLPGYYEHQFPAAEQAPKVLKI